MDDGSETIKVSDLKKFISDCFCAMGVNKSNSSIMAESLVGADLIGHHSHGVFRIDKFISDVQKGNMNVCGEPTILKETPASAWVDGNNTLGPVVGTFCMKIAIDKAKQVGAAIVTTNNSNNFGVASFYSTQALKEGLIGLCLSNSSPLMLPTRAKESVAGTNPISLAASGLFGDYFLLDMATSVTSGGNIELKHKDGKFLPVGWAMNAACLPETNADVALKSRRFLPLGSQEELSSYKGSGLSLMVDILCGVLTGAHYSTMVGVWLSGNRNAHANVGHCFIVIDPKRFAPAFDVRLTELMSYLRGLQPGNPHKPTKIPGDRGKEIMRAVAETGGITYYKYIVDVLKKIANELKINCVPFIPKERKVKMSPSAELSALFKPEKNLIQEVSSSPTEENLALPENSLVDKESSFVLEDSSEWLCPMAGLTYERDRAASLLKEKIDQYSRESSIQKSEDMNETERNDLNAETISDSDRRLMQVFEEGEREEIQIKIEIDGAIHITGSGKG